MLRFAEELLLFLIDGDSGSLALVPERDLNHALAGAVLMDLAHENRIDTDLQQLTVVDSAPLGDDVLDPVLARLAENPETACAEYWVRHFAQDGERIRASSLQRLVEAGIIRSADEGAIETTTKVARAKRYPTVGGKAEQEVRLRIMGVLFSDDVPGPRDVVIICLADACGVFKGMLAKAEFEEARERIDTVRRLDLIGQAVTRAVRESESEEKKTPRPRLKKPPMAKGLPFVGNVREASIDLGRFLAEQYVELGPMFEVRILRRTLLVLAGEEANRFVNRQGRRCFSSREPFQGLAEGLNMHRIVLNMEGQEHFAIRKAFAPALGRPRFNQCFDLANEVVHRQVAALPVGRPLHPLPFLQQVVAEQMGRILANRSASEQVEDMATMLDILLKTKVTKQLPWLLFASRFKKAKGGVETVAHEILEAHGPGGPFHDSGDFISDLIDLNRRDPQLIPETDMSGWAIAPFLAGMETVANTCAFNLYAALKYPELKEKVVAEADAFFSGGPSAAKLAELDVTRRLIMESMRMWPAAPVLFRVAANSFDFAGYHVSAGTPMFLPQAATHHLPEHFPEPQRFDVDRYLPERAEHRQPHAYVPYGVGVHRCLGAGFADLQTLLILAVLMNGVEMELHPRNYELQVSNIPTPRPAKNFKIKVTRRREV